LHIYRSRPAVLKHGNFGDELTALLLGRLFGRETMPVRLEEAELIGAGSILDAYGRYTASISRWGRIKQLAREAIHRPPSRLHVWGSGAMLADSSIHWPQQPIYHAVRGKLTAGRLCEAAPLALGDPGILAARLLDPRPVADAQVALVPHFVDEHHVAGLDLPQRWKVVHTDRDASATIRAIAASELVISSSLHGLITADAFSIPCIWARSHHDLYKRSDYKFHDHASVRGAAFNSPMGYEELAGRSSSELQGMATTAARDLDEWANSLIAAFPDELKP
jgi:pyruvyltransferase